MTKKNKVILSTCLVLPTVLTSTVVLSSCSTTHPFVKPAPIDLNNTFNALKTSLNKFNNKLNEMTDFNDVFKYEKELLNELKTNKQFDFNENIINVNIDITPKYENNKLSYSLEYCIDFKKGVEINFNNQEGYKLQNSRLVSKTFDLNNSSLIADPSSISFWISDANVISTRTYAALELNNNSFNFVYDNEIQTIDKRKIINTSISKFKTINIYINNVIEDTEGTNWLSVIDLSSSNFEQTNNTISVNFKYNYKSVNQTILSNSITSGNYTFNITPTQNNQQ